MSQAKNLPAGFALMVCVWVGAVPAFGALSVDNQSLVVHVDGSGPTAAPVTTITFNQTQTADPFAPFNQTVSGQLPSASGTGLEATASANQVSQLTATSQGLHLTASGNASAGADVQSASKTQSTYFVVFTVDAPTTYSLTESTDQMGEGTNANFNLRSLGAALLPGTQPLSVSTFGTSLIPSVGDPTFLGQTQATFSGTLSAGTYTFTGGVDGTVQDDGGSGIFAVDFTVGSSAASVPLPQAFVMGLMTLVLVSGFIPLLSRWWSNQPC
jgi:hypothetical protein